MLVLLESVLFNVSVNTTQERELLFIAWERINAINHFIHFAHKKKVLMM